MMTYVTYPIYATFQLEQMRNNAYSSRYNWVQLCRWRGMLYFNDNNCIFKISINIKFIYIKEKNIGWMMYTLSFANCAKLSMDSLFAVFPNNFFKWEERKKRLNEFV